MSTRFADYDKASAPLTTFVSLALAQNSRSGLTEILKSIARAVNAYGCVLWEVAPGSNFDAEPPRGHLFVLDQWLEDGRIYAFNDLPPHSAAGYTVLTRKTLNVEDVSTDLHVSTDPRYLRRLGVKTLVSVPIIFPDSTRRGAITVYRTSGDPFTEDEISLIEQLSLLVPALYQTIRVKLIFSLTRRVDLMLGRAKLITHGKQLSRKEVKAEVAKALSRVCMTVSDAFKCIETSVFLEDRSEAPGRYELVATTWPEPVVKKVISKGEKGLTGWVLTHGKPVRIFDLGNFERHRSAIRSEYPELFWTDALDIKSSVRRFLNVDHNDKLPPLSFMAAPIKIGGRILGTIRCAVVKKGPYYFAEDDLNLLELVAAKISQYWSGWLNELETHEESQAWQMFSESIGKLNAFALSKLTIDREPIESEIFVEALRVAHSVINGAEILDIRMLDRQTNELYFAATQGHVWNQGSLKEIKARKRRRFPVNDTPPTSAGAYVFQNAQVYSILPDISDDPFYSEELIFPSVRRMIIAPIGIGGYTYGVLDIRGLSNKNFSRNAVAIAEVLGKQLGLYHFIAETVDLLRKAQDALTEQVKERIQSLEDLAHQLKSPINQVQARIQSVLRDAPSGDRSLLAIRGLTRRAKRVAMSTMIFSSLASGKTIKPKSVTLDRETAVRLLIEAASDNELMIDPSRHINITVKRESLDILESNVVKVDHDLLEQALNNILDNAGKYSYPNSVIEIFAGLTTRTRRFYISVANVGIPLKPGDLHECVKRGWRSENAKLITGEGSGIGLWIVKNIMEIQNGELRIIHTTLSNRTEIKLIFPTSNAK
jgi:GAF domain-containing protein